MAATLLWDDDSTSSQKPQENSLSDLLVFGYACKLFRDDEKAKFIDEGKHLIPWMGDERHMIDRYDGRGHLFDLSKHDADLMKGRRVELTEEEEAVERACDEERYLELVVDVQEKVMYEEEEWKRYYESLQEGYKAVGFSYEPPPATETPPEAEAEEKDEVFVPTEELMVPQGIPVPQTEKEHARIEKTAIFIAQHGIQMEIMIKTKQARNPQFEFMNFENPLNTYYKHLVQIIKSGKYKPHQPDDNKQQEQDQGDQHYLHPSLSNTVTALPPPPPPKKIEMPKVNVHDTHYGQLISSLQKYSHVIEQPKKEEKVHINSHDAKLQPQQSLPPFMAQPDYGGSSLDAVTSNHHPHHGPQPHHHHHHHHHRVKEERLEPPPPGTEVAKPFSGPQPFNDVQQGCENRSSPGPQQIVPPAPDIQPIIDRMAMYVAKNGVEFELVVKSKRDPRFSFLEAGHVHFQYYDFKKNMFLKEAELKKRLEAKQAERERQKKEEEAAAAANRSISFSIKGRSREPEAGTLKRPLFDYDSSDGEAEEDGSRKDPMSRSSTPDSATLRAAALATLPSSMMTALSTSDAKQPSIPTDEMEKRHADERLKDRLAVAAREKLQSTNKEKQLQLERKKKAALFINLLRIVKDSPLPDDKPKAEGNAEAKPADGASSANSPSSVVVFDYNNRSGTPTRLDKMETNDAHRKSRSKSPSEKRKKRRKRSPTPPSAYANPHRSPPRFSPNRIRSRSPRRGPMVPRRMSPPIRPCRLRRSASPIAHQVRRSRSPLRKKNKRSRSRSRSPSGKQHKKKHKRSRSKTPKKKKKVRSHSTERESSKHSHKSSDKHRDKKKDKEKKKDKDKDKKDRHKSKDSRHKDDHKKTADKPPVKSSSVSSKDKDGTTSPETPAKRKRAVPSKPSPSPVKSDAKSSSPIAEIIDSSSSDSSSSSDDDDVIRVGCGDDRSKARSSAGERNGVHGSLSPLPVSSSSTTRASKSQESVTERDSMDDL